MTGSSAKACQVLTKVAVHRELADRLLDRELPQRRHRDVDGVHRIRDRGDDFRGQSFRALQ
jgi:hypothetical protein